jgi:hypothetical protein
MPALKLADMRLQIYPLWEPIKQVANGELFPACFLKKVLCFYTSQKMRVDEEVCNDYSEQTTY